MKPVDVKPKTYINISKESNYKETKFKISNYVRITFHIGPEKFLLFK